MGWKPRADAAADWAVFLRAVNVGGRTPLPMARLRELLADLGARDVATYIQSGNAVFAASSDLGRAIQPALEDALERELGFAVPVVLRGIADLQAVLAANPFADSGTPIANGMSDYFALLNKRDGGINGVKLVVEECETGYKTDVGVE